MLRLILTILLFLGTIPYAFAAEYTIEKGFTITSLRGYSRALATATISSEVSGRIERLNYREGDTIGSKPLVEIDRTFINLDIRDLDINLKSIEVSEKKLSSRLTFLEKEFLRRQRLVQNGRIATVSFEEIEQQRDQTVLEQEALRIKKSALKIKRQRLEEQLKRYHPTARQGWKISRRLIESGEIVAPGTPLFQVQNFAAMLVPLTVTNQQLQQLQQIKRNISAKLSGEKATCQIYSISPDFDEKTRKIHIELRVNSSSIEPRGGLPLTLDIKIPKPGVMIHRDALINRYEQPRIELPSGKRVHVQILDTAGDFIRIARHPDLLPGTELTY